MKTKRNPMRVLRLAPCVLLLQACVIPLGGAQVGDLRVTWSFDGSQRCSAAGVDQVNVQLIEKGKEGTEDGNAFGLAADCIAGSLVLPDVIAGTYTMTVTGIGEVAIYNNDKGVDVEVAPGALTDVVAQLALVNGEVVSRVEFRYRFDGDGSCSAAGIDAINAQVIDSEGTPIAGSTTPCLDGLAAVDGISTRGERTLHIEAIDADGNVRFRGDKELQNLQPGETLPLGIIDMVAASADVTARFTFDNVPFCAQAGVDTIDAQLLDAEGRIIQGQTIDCIVGSVVFTDIPVGTYTLHADAIDANNVVLYARDLEDVVIQTATVDVGIVNLTALASTVRVRFRLPDDQSCAEAGVDSVDIQIVDEENNVTGINVPCINGDSGDLLGPAPGQVTVRAQALSGVDVAFDGEVEGETIRAGANDVEVELEPVSTTLELSWDFVTVNVPNVQSSTVPQFDRTVFCAEADVDTINVRVSLGVRLVEAVTVDCLAGRVELPGLPVGDLSIELEGTRQQEGDSIYFGRDDNSDDRTQGFIPDDPLAVNVDVVATGARTAVNVRLSPNLPFARVVWAGDCGVTESASVDIQITAGGVSTGINVPCANGNAVVALPPGSESSPVSIALRGVSGQGVARTLRDAINDVNVVLGVNTFRFLGPL
ncbi:MAG: hypothetical protein FJ137_17150 [Deltaproteobacteria bacterium]|nr:hypothetical protein [Deltaproteobacteria bacterium]